MLVTSLNVDPVGYSACDRAVEQRLALVVRQVLDRLRRHRRRVDARIERRVGAHPEDRAVVDVHRDERAGLALPPVEQRLLAGLLDLQIERQLQVVPGDGIHPRQLPAAWLAGGVDLDPDRPVAAAEHAVVLLLEAGGADPVAGLETVVDLFLQLLGVDLADESEEVGAKRPVRVVADVDLLDADSGEAVLALAQEVDEVLVRPSAASVTGLAGRSAVCSLISFLIFMSGIWATWPSRFSSLLPGLVVPPAARPGGPAATATSGCRRAPCRCGRGSRRAAPGP